MISEIFRTLDNGQYTENQLKVNEISTKEPKGERKAREEKKRIKIRLFFAGKSSNQTE